jgi:hypothetical protein
MGKNEKAEIMVKIYEINETYFKAIHLINEAIGELDDVRERLSQSILIPVNGS